MAEVGEPTQYGYAERLMRTIKEEEVDLSEYRDYHDVYQHISCCKLALRLHFLLRKPQWAKIIQRTA